MLIVFECPSLVIQVIWIDFLIKQGRIKIGIIFMSFISFRKLIGIGRNNLIKNVWKRLFAGTLPANNNELHQTHTPQAGYWVRDPGLKIFVLIFSLVFHRLVLIVVLLVFDKDRFFKFRERFPLSWMNYQIIIVRI